MSDLPQAGTRSSRIPGWLLWTGVGLAGVSALGLPVAVIVAGLDIVRRQGSVSEQGIVLGGLILGAVAMVVAVERGLSYAVTHQDWSLWSGLAVIGGVSALVVLGVLVPAVGLVLIAIGVLLVLLLVPAALAFVAWLRWQHAAVATPRTPPSTAEVRARAEQRRAVVRGRHDRTRTAVAAGLIGPGFTRGRSR